MKINQRLTLCFSLLFCLLSISYASAQQLNISGVVISSEDNEPLIGATVSVKGNPTKGVITDINGQFQLSVETGTKMLVRSVLADPVNEDLEKLPYPVTTTSSISIVSGISTILSSFSLRGTRISCVFIPT